MSDIALKVENLSKLYRLGEVGTGTISHDLNRWIARVRGKEDPFSKVGETNDRTSKKNSKNGYVWSLKDINFEVKKGDVVGIIGKNGAGKSTLLKVISQITAPTTGSIKAKGRIASLLEVGTGMHPEMTGRENIYLNGTILGMRKWEIDRKFDEIVDFAGCAKYVDTPVKRYSSGMKVRLGFAVAAFLEPEILIVDEVLAVGDAEFQKKAIGKMQEVSKGEGRSVLFVSHNMASIQSLCNKAILLKDGSLEFASDTNRVIQYYLTNFEQESNSVYVRSGHDNKQVWIKEAYIELLGKKVSSIMSGSDIDFVIKYESAENDLKCSLYIGVYDNMGDKILHLGLPYSGENGVFSTKKSGELRCKIPRVPLPEGCYFINISLHLNDVPYDRIQNAVGFNVEFGDFYGNGKLPSKSENKFLIDQEWSILN